MKFAKLARADVLLSLLATVLLQLEVWFFDPGPPATVRSLLCLVASGALAFLQPFPVGAYLANGFAIYGLIAVSSPSDLYQWTNLLALVLMAARTPLRRGLVPLLLGLGGVAFYFWRFPNEGGIVTMFAVQALYGAGFLGGTSQRARLRSERLEAERDLAEARLVAGSAKAELESERSRMARELHDVVGHALTTVVLHAGAAERSLEQDPETTRRALRTIAAQGRQALSDMDRMLRVLHGETPTTPLPSLENLSDLITGLTEPEVTVRVEGDLSKVPPSVSLTGYRLVQEGLTNALKHSEARHVRIEISAARDLVIRVGDDGVGGTAAPGRGLTGIVERVELHGGSASFGPGTDRGFVIEARIPLP